MAFLVGLCHRHLFTPKTVTVRNVLNRNMSRRA